MDFVGLLCPITRPRVRLARVVTFLLGFFILAVVAPPAVAQPCVVPDNGGGTVDLPPAGCPYLSPDEFHAIVDGLPPGTTIRIDPIHAQFFNVTTTPLPDGGEQENFDSFLTLEMTGQGPGLDGFSRTLLVQVACEVVTGPRGSGSTQTFDTEMVSLQGQLFGDPDFDFLSIQAGGAFGLPSPGQTTLTNLPSGDWNVDSFFDIAYTIDFQGAPGSQLDGMAGSTTATVRMQGGQPAPGIPPCIVQDNGTGTVDLPPPGCGYVSPDEFHVILDGVPAGTTINIDPAHNRFFNVTTTTGGNLGGEVETFDSFVDLQMTGTGALAGFSRFITVPIAAETHTGPRNPGDSVQSFDTEMVQLQGSIFGDPDFDELTIQGGSSFGLPSPGHTTLTRIEGSGQFNVDSFFDVTYTITFQGAPGGALDGLGGTTQGTVNMNAGGPACPPIPAGTDTFPSTAKLILNLDAVPDPIVVRLSSADLADTIVQRQPQNGRTIDVEILSMDLSGSHPMIGPIDVQLSPAQPSLGQINNILQDPTTCELISADSFFDVIVDINLPALGETWSCTRPLHLRSELFRLPPEDAKYENPFVDPVQLIDNASGDPRGEIVYHLHHVDPPLPPPGPDCFDTFMDAQLNLPSLGFFGTVSAFGPTTVDRGPPQVSGSCDISGTSCQSDADCPLGEICIRTQNQIQTEMVSMDLSGFDPLLGGFQVRISPTGPPSGGQAISQNPGTSTFAVDSFFDVFFEIDLVDQGIVLHNDQPLPVQAGPNGPSIGARNIPPDPQTPFEQQGPPVPLVTEDGSPVGDIQGVNHIIDIPRDWQPPPPNDEYCFDSWVHLEVTMFNPFCQDILWLHGAFRILRDDPIDSTGDAILDLMNTLMAKAQFHGDSDCLGALTAALNRNQTSAGSVSRLNPNEFYPADSFFDVYVEMETGIGRLHTQDPSFMTTTINNLPPDDGEIYYGPGTIIPLYQGICSPSGDSCITDADCRVGDVCQVQQIGEILELEHRVHRQIECPADCNWFLRFNPVSPSNKSRMSLQGPGTGLGLQYDIVRGTLGVLKTNPRPNWSDAARIGTNVGPTFVDNAVPLPGQGFYYVARDGFGAFNGTYNSGGLGQQGNRDPFLP